jgi:chemotaxis protein MotB
LNFLLKNRSILQVSLIQKALFKSKVHTPDTGAVSIEICIETFITQIMRYAFLFLLFITAACVPQKKYAELKSNYDKSEAERNYLSGAVKDLEIKNKEASAEIERLKKENEIYKNDYTALKTRLLQLQDKYTKLEQFKDQLTESQSKNSATSEAENRKLLTEMIKAQEDLQKREDELKEMEKRLNTKQADLGKLFQQLEGMRKDLNDADIALQKRETRIKELEDLISRKDAALSTLRDRIANALLQYADKGLKVEQRNGRIYVSMEAKLLFPSGSTVINEEGKGALKQLAGILAENPDMTVLVEGHTDTDPLRGTGAIKDNWDLSVMRSTEVVKYMLSSSKMNAQTLTAAGRGEFMPIAPNDTPVNKAKNRRIEVILTPNLDRLFQILDEEAGQIKKTDTPADLEDPKSHNKKD